MRRRLVAGRRNEVFLGNLCALFNAGNLGALTDGQLLERFCTGPEAEAELAFTALIDRHGPVVQRICRGMLRNEHDSQDAFQATFLVLLRQRARSGSGIRWGPGCTRWPTGSLEAPARPRIAGRGTSGRRHSCIRNGRPKSELQRTTPTRPKLKQCTRRSPGCRRDTATPWCSVTWRVTRTSWRRGTWGVRWALSRAGWLGGVKS